MKYTAIFPNGLQSFLLCLEGIDNTTQQFFREALNLAQLGQPAISNLTAKHLDIRMTDPNASHHVEVIEAKWKVVENEVVLYFYVSPTYDNPATVLTPNNAREYPGTFYNVVFQFSGVEASLGTLEQFTALSKNARERAMKSMIWSCPVKVYSNDPSFYYQGVWEDLAKVDGVVFNFPGPPGKDIWHNRHAAAGGLSNSNIRVTKHIGQIITHMYSFIPVITKALKKVE